MEDLTKKVSRSERMKELVEILEQGSNKTNSKRYSVTPLMNHIAEMMQLAYIAGANRDYTNGIEDEMKKIESIDFIKDKGYKL